MRIALFLIVITAITTCTSQPAPSTIPPSPTNPTTPLLEERLEIEANYEILRQTHVTLSTLWENLQQGGTAACSQTEFRIPQDLTQPDLAHAASQLRHAANLWHRECQNPRTKVPPETINQGILAIRAAGDALATVEELLNR